MRWLRWRLRLGQVLRRRGLESGQYCRPQIYCLGPLACPDGGEGAGGGADRQRKIDTVQRQRQRHTKVYGEEKKSFSFTLSFN